MKARDAIAVSSHADDDFGANLTSELIPRLLCSVAHHANMQSTFTWGVDYKAAI
jgi:hypothetical protein